MGRRPEFIDEDFYVEGAPHWSASYSPAFQEAVYLLGYDPYPEDIFERLDVLQKRITNEDELNMLGDLCSTPPLIAFERELYMKKQTAKKAHD